MNKNQNYISFQSNIKFTNTLYLRSIEEIFDMIKTGGAQIYDLINKTNRVQAESNHDIQNRLKVQYLPYACFNGRFERRLDSALIAYSNCTAIDFDGFGSEEELQQVKYWLTCVPCVQFIFRSPSGKGLKVIVSHTNNEPEKHRALYHELMQLFLLKELDTKTSDLSRATFICYDPDAWWNDNCVPYEFDESKYDNDADCTYSYVSSTRFLQCDYASKVAYFNSLACDQQGISDGSIKRIVNSWLNKENIVEGKRNNLLFKYACKLCNAGVHYDFAVQLLVDYFGIHGLAEEEVLVTVCNAYSKCCKSFGTERYKYGKRKVK